jgi:1-deoxy-D-xylulose-5-phosphate reductoisomerase
MKKKIVILGSTGSIGKCLLNIIDKDQKSFEVVLLSAHKNFKELFKQAKQFKVKNLIITDIKTYKYVLNKYKIKNFRIFNKFNVLDKILTKKVDYTMSSIVGLEGLYPTIKMIKYSKTIAIANKETIICAWNLIKVKLKKYKTNFIPVDSEHFSIWSSIKSLTSSVEKIYLTASGGPFYQKKFSNLKNIKIYQALNHPTWKMGKKITIDSATLMNKIFELIEAKKIFNLKFSNLDILVHPDSYVHAIIKQNNGLINIIAHDTSMTIPIFNSLYWNSDKTLKNNSINLKKLNSLNFSPVKKNNFPVITLIKSIPDKDSLFETVIVSVNDYLVNLFLNKKIQYTSITKLLIKILSMTKFTKFKKKDPKTITDIMQTRTFTLKEIKKISFNDYN